MIKYEQHVHLKSSCAAVFCQIQARLCDQDFAGGLVPHEDDHSAYYGDCEGRTQPKFPASMANASASSDVEGLYPWAGSAEHGQNDVDCTTHEMTGLHINHS